MLRCQLIYTVSHIWFDKMVAVEVASFHISFDEFISTIQRKTVELMQIFPFLRAISLIFNKNCPTRSLSISSNPPFSAKHQVKAEKLLSLAQVHQDAYNHVAVYVQRLQQMRDASFQRSFIQSMDKVTFYLQRLEKYVLKGRF